MRPSLHFTAQSGWINDPHGITFRDGKYHVFYQYVPERTEWALNCHWGHAIGDDLLSLRELPVAIAPGDGEDGVWSGCIVTNEGGESTAFYTATTAPNLSDGKVRVAHPADSEWTEWVKGDVVVQAPPELDVAVFRDPIVRREGDGWRMFVGVSLGHGQPAVLSYTSADLTEWSYDGITLRSTGAEPVWLGSLWECPQLIEFGDRAVMLFSVWEADELYYAAYAVGEYVEGVFTAHSWHRLTFGDSYYAPSVFIDAAGEPALSIWMRGVGGPEHGWAGAHSVPFRLSLKNDRLFAKHHPDVAAHRGAAGGSNAVAGLAADIVWNGEVDGELAVLSGGAPVVNILRESASLRVQVAQSETIMPVDGVVRVILDGPIVEISSRAGLFGGVVAPTGTELSIVAPSGEVEIYALA